MKNRMLKKTLERVKGDAFNIDDNISDRELLFILINKFTQYYRGIYKCLGIKGSKKKIFIGKKVTIRNKKHISMGTLVRIGDYVELDGLSKEGLSFGNNCSIGKYSIIRGTGGLAVLGMGITFGNNSSCADNCFFGCSGGIIIGNDVIIGQNVRFHSQSHNFKNLNVLIRKQGVTSKGIKVGNNNWIGSGVVILDDVKIGNNCVIGANTLVNKDIPSNSVAVGNPVKIIKSREINIDE